MHVFAQYTLCTKLYNRLIAHFLYWYITWSHPVDWFAPFGLKMNWKVHSVANRRPFKSSDQAFRDALGSVVIPCSTEDREQWLLAMCVCVCCVCVFSYFYFLNAFHEVGEASQQNDWGMLIRLWKDLEQFYVLCQRRRMFAKKSVRWHG